MHKYNNLLSIPCESAGANYSSKMDLTVQLCVMPRLKTC